MNRVTELKRRKVDKLAFEELISPTKFTTHRWSDWARAYRATTEFFDRRLPASGERQ